MGSGDETTVNIVQIICTRYSEVFDTILKLINTSLCLNKGHHDRDGVCISDLNYWYYKFLRFLTVVLDSIEMIYQTLKPVFDNIKIQTPRSLSKILPWAFALCCICIFNFLLSIWKCGQT